MPAQDREVMLSSFLRWSIHRAFTTMPLYRHNRYSSYDVAGVHQLGDILTAPLLVKDGHAQAELPGFRDSAQEDPELLRPHDIHSAHVYKSGGTKGASTPTYITDNDLSIEAYSLARRSFLSGGMRAHERLYSCYNPTHKGGELIKRAGMILGKRTVFVKRPEDDVAQIVRDLKAHKITTIAAVQPPLHQNSQTTKKGTSFLNIFKTDHTLFGSEGQVQKAFVTGYALPDELIRLANDIGLSLFTAWGSTEAIVGATSTIGGPESRVCKHNNQHLVLGPHALMVAKIADGKLVPAKEGEEGILLVNTIAREGTLYFNYAIGDVATLVATSCPCGRTTPVIGNIRRIDNPAEIFSMGCRLD